MLSAADFPAFFSEVWGHAPFPWQARLVREVLDQGGRWPELLDLPTGAGKTATLDAALFALAAAPDRCPRRIVLLVDRRTIVDQAHRRALGLADALARAEADPAARPASARVAAALRALAGPRTRDDEPVVDVALLRGGVPQDGDWARTPSRPVLAASTVDQVGSRLLFRGYGLSDGMKPVHAGLLGTDTLLLLDEVHLSGAFHRTLTALAPRRVGEGLPDRWQAVSLSATPGAGAARRFGLADDDRGHAALGPRLRAQKPTTLHTVAGKGEARLREALVGALAAAALQAVRPGEAVAVVVNRVDTALALQAALAGRPGAHPIDPLRPALPADGFGLALVTGRMRGLARDALGGFLADRLQPGHPRTGAGPALIVVATQCIEAGADYDFDALITECPSLDALRQRAGRVDRAGSRGRSPVQVWVREDQVAADADDPIYGNAVARTWAWLRERADGLDLGPGGTAPPDDPTPFQAPQPSPPVLLPAYLDAWVQTAPRPAPEPEPAHFLHGLRPPGAEVQLCWRVDVDPEQLAAFEPAHAQALLAACPPRPGELLSVPLHAARALLTRGQPGPGRDAEVDLGADLEGGAAPPEDRRAADPAAAPPVALRWAGPESDRTAPVRAAELRPGDVLVLPAALGGLRAESFDPSAEAPVADLAEAAAARAGRGLRLRLHPAVLRALELPAFSPVGADAEDAPSPREQVAAWAAGLTLPPAMRGPAGDKLLRRGRIVPLDLPAGGWWVLVGRDADATTEGEEGSFTGGAVALDLHLRGVEALARDFAKACGLPPELVDALARAGRLHDLGKADPRFQALLHGGDPVATARALARGRPAGAPELAGLLAKSAQGPGDRAARERAAARSGYPRGARHELLSVALVQAAPGLLDGAADPDLVLHLVASHHGHCRPFAPPVDDPAPREVGLRWQGVAAAASSGHGLAALGSGVAERFWALTRRYGPHGLAALEAILRLADHRRSELEQQGDPA